jgi:hypothetical protein
MKINPNKTKARIGFFSFPVDSYQHSPNDINHELGLDFMYASDNLKVGSSRLDAHSAVGFNRWRGGIGGTGETRLYSRPVSENAARAISGEAAVRLQPMLGADGKHIKPLA